MARRKVGMIRYGIVSGDVTSQRPPHALSVGVSPLLILAIALLAVCGPLLLFPNLLPDAWQIPVVTGITGVAFGLALIVLHPWKQIRVTLWLFLIAVMARWGLMPSHDEIGLRHFAGIGVGVLSMAIVAKWCTTSERILVATTVFAAGATVVLTLGLLSTSVDLAKFAMPGGSTPSQVLVAPRLSVDLPGLPPNREVNGNALGGTALMVLPLCAGLAVAGLRVLRRRRLVMAFGGVATTVALLVLVLSLSRTAWLAALLTAMVWGLRWQRGRRRVVLGLTLLIAGLAIAAGLWRVASPETFASAIHSTQQTVIIRMSVWMDAMDRLRLMPWLGIGISQFHEVPRTTAMLGAKMLVPHAHNIFIQVALDVGVIGLTGYLLLFATLLWLADRRARQIDAVGHVVAGAGLALVAVHVFGIGDAIALGAKVGVFQWLCAGLILAAAHLPRATD